MKLFGRRKSKTLPATNSTSQVPAGPCGQQPPAPADDRSADSAAPVVNTFRWGLGCNLVWEPSQLHPPPAAAAPDIECVAVSTFLVLVVERVDVGPLLITTY